VFSYKVTDFWHPGDECGIAWNDPDIGIIWPDLQGKYLGTADGEGYKMSDGTPLNLRDKDRQWGRLFAQ
jgi:dTDP-4-dehydrorhamnose 3,5-epimerase